MYPFKSKKPREQRYVDNDGMNVVEYVFGYDNTGYVMPEPPPVAPEKPTATVADVHADFDNAPAMILAAANAVLDKANKAEAEEYLQVASLGFYSAKNVKAGRAVAAELAKALQVIDYVAHYGERYPTCRFITEERVTEICGKYGLVHGEAAEFIGDIPKENRADIVAFTCRDEDKRYERESPARSWHFEEIDYASHLENPGACVSRFSIVATIEEFDVTNKKVDAQYRLVDKDPIVLYSVAGGYLVVTAWGDEAEAVK